jgi:subtilisin family serine protease
VADSVSVTTESRDIPGEHGTHVAGCIASRDAVFAGIAPGVELIDVKVLHANGSGNVGDVARGIDAALDRGADILSLSLGANHLPTWSENGHGWFCPAGDCELCTAVDNAVALDAATVVVAAGNDRARADALRAQGFGNAFDTELSCPGQAAGAVTVGAVTKRTRIPAGFSSRGPSADGRPKPDIAAPGVNVTSTVAVPRDPFGNPSPDPSRAVLFERMSGTSMATPIVSAIAALKLQRRRMRGEDTSPAAIRAELLGDSVRLDADPSEVGAGFAHI